MQIKIASTDDISIIQEIAFNTWPHAYKDILSTQQLNYMMDLMYNKEELRSQFEDKNYSFIISLSNNTPTGFASYSFISQQNSYKLHKLYILPDYQLKSIGKYIMNYILSDLKTKNAKRLMLNVNRNNKAIQFYLNQDFKIIKEEDNDIGNGFYMNDYVMEKLID